MTRELYIQAIEKAAAMAAEPNYHINSAEVAREEHKANMGDARTQLKGLFSNAGAVEQNTTSTMDRLLPDKSGMDRETSNPLLKVAFYLNVEGAFNKIAEHRHLHFQSFLRELQKIAVNQVGGMLRALGKGTSAAASAVKPTSAAAANQAMQGFKRIAGSPTAMPSFQGLAR